MTTAPTSAPAVGRRSTARVLLTVLPVLGAAWALWHGIAGARATARESGAWLVDVPVRTTAALPPGAFEMTTPHGIPRLQPDGTRLTLWLESPSSSTALLAGSARWLPWLAAALIVLLAIPVLRRVTQGRVFERATVRAVIAITALVALAWLADGLLPLIAAQHAIRTGQTGLPAEWFTADLRLAVWPVGYLVALAVIALVVRAGIPRLPAPWEDAPEDRAEPARTPGGS